MAEMIAEYKDDSGFYIVKVADGQYYYGNGEDVNGFGISANQFLRYNPYMKRTDDKAPDQIIGWINEHMKE